LFILVISAFSIKIIIGTSWILILVIELNQHYGITPFPLILGKRHAEKIKNQADYSA